MLVLTRRIGESILVPQRELTVKILEVWGNKVRLGITAPYSTKILRQELRPFPPEPVLADSSSACHSPKQEVSLLS
jgi:carbon storage regulator CsrA